MSSQPIGDAVHSTITTEDARARLWDVIVVGAGPAGSVVARQLAERGVRVLLLDKRTFPRAKVCGCCIGHAGVRALDRIGLAHVLDDASAPEISTLELHAGEAVSRLPLPTGRVISRESLDSALIRAAVQSGGDCILGVSATVLSAVGATRQVRVIGTTGEAVIAARVVVAADGLAGTSLRECTEIRSVVSARARVGAGTILSAGPQVAAGAIQMHVGRAGYVGLVRLETGATDVAAAVDPAAVRAHGSLAQTIGAILSESGGERFIDGVLRANWKGTPPLTRRRTPIASHRLLLLGDVAGYVEPFTGEGMTWAIESAVAGAPKLCDGLANWTAAIERDLINGQRALVRNRQLACSAVATLLRIPLLVRTATRALGRVPQLATPLVRQVAGKH